MGKDSSPTTKDHQSITILSENEDLDGNPTESSKEEKKTVSRQKKILLDHLLDHCPRSSEEARCTQCKVQSGAKGSELCCHCGSKPVTLPNGRVQNAQVHWASRELIM